MAQIKKVYFILFAFASFAFASFAFASFVYANSEFIVRLENKEPYLIVYEDDSTESTKAPGIYTRTKGKNGKWQLRFPGNIATGSTSKGVLAQFPLDRMEAVTVIDGKVTLFHLDSLKQKPTTFLQLGSKRAAAWDPIFKHKISLPEISSLDDVTIAYVRKGGWPPPPSGIVPILISIKLDTPTLEGGDGITVLLPLREDPRKSSTQLDLLYPPMVIDYKFQTQSQLEKLFNSLDDAFIILSRQLLEQYSAPDETDPKFLKDWKKSLKSVINKLNRNERDYLNNRPGVPYIELTTGKIEITSVIQEIVPVTSEIRFAQVFDPLHAWRGILLEAHGEHRLKHIDPDQFEFYGSMDTDEKGKPRIFTQKGVQDSALVGIHGELYLFIQKGYSGKYYFKVLDKEAQSTLNDISFFVLEVESSKAATQYYVFISTVRSPKSGNKNAKPVRKTQVFVLEKAQGRALKEVRNINLSDTFYTAEELEYRTRDLSDLSEDNISAEQDKIIFDRFTPKQKSKKAYEQAFDATLVQINVTDSKEGDLEEIYGVSEGDIALVSAEHDDGNAAIVYHQYNAQHATENQSGLYFRPIEKQPLVPSAIFGQYLQAPWGLEEGEALWGSSIELSGELFGEKNRTHILDLQVAAMDTAFEKGALGYTVYFILSSPGNKFYPKVSSASFRSPFKNLKTVEAFWGVKKHANEVSFLFSVEPDTRRQKRWKGGVFQYTFRIEPSSQDKSFILKPLAEEEKLADEVIVSSEMMTRIQLDENGQVYWVSTPGVARTDDKFSIVRLADETNIYTNSPQGRRFAFKPFQEMLEKGEIEGSGFMYAKWRVWTEYKVSDYIKKFEEIERRLRGATQALPSKKGSSYDEDEEENEEKPDEKSRAEQLEVERRKLLGVKKVDLFQRMAESYPYLYQTLQRLVENKQPKNQILLVPEEQKEHLMGFLFKLWAEPPATEHDQRRLPENFAWSKMNERMKLYVMDGEDASQEDFFENLSVMAEKQKRDRPVLVVDLDALAAIGRPKAREEIQFTLFPVMEGASSPASNDALVDEVDDVDEVDEEVEDETEGEEVEEEVDETERAWENVPSASGDKIPPHALYLISTEGRRLDLKDFKELKPEMRSVSVLLVGSKRSWEKIKQDVKMEDAVGFLKQFDQVISFYHGSWRLWGPSSSKVHPSILELLKKGVGRFRERIFPTLEENFNRMADPKAQAVHKIVIVPAELKDFVKDMVVARWADLKSEDPNWNFRNQNLFLYQLDQGTIDSSQNQSQDVVLENLAVMRELPKGQAPVLLGDLATIRNLGRVEAEGGSDKTFYVQDYVLDEPESGQWGIDDVEPENVLPHLLYLLATEGNRLPLKEFQAATKLPPKRMSMLLVGTEQEWDKIQRDIGIENRFGLSDHFEVEHLKIPDHATRKEMLLGVLERPEVKSLEYHFDSRMPGARKDAISPEQARNEILSIMVSECERRALENKVNIVAAFLKLYQTFRKAVLEDEELRRDRVIDRRFVQRLMARNFRVQLNPELLPPTDYLRLLQNQDLPLQVEKAGYTGSFEMTERVAHILKEQLNPASKLTIPASLIVIGETSSGKTSLVQAFIRVLGLKEYDFEKPHDPGAQVFYLNCRKVVESKSELREGEIAVDDALKHFDHFLTLPHGYRGLVFFDDIHAPKDSVKTKILARLQSLVESENGIWRGRSPFLKDSEIIEVPLQNLSLIVALNPISDQKKIAQFQKRGTKGEPTTEELILASISTDALMFDTSFLVRFSEIIRMDTFSAQAKAPALLAEMRKSGQAIFNTKNRLILVAPESAELIQRAFPNLNARIFLSQAAPALLTAENTDPQASRVQIIVPRRRVLTGDIPLEDIDPDDFFEDDEEDGVSNQDKHRRDRKLQAYIEKYVKSIPISQGYEGPLELLRYVMSSFRFHVYESFIGVLGRDGRFIVDETTKFYKYAPLLHAIRTHLETNRGIRLEEIVLDPKDFGATNKAQEIDFMQALKERDRGVDRGFRPAWIFQPTRGVSLERVFDNMTTGGLVSHSRRDVLNRLCLALDLQLKEYLKVILKISDPELPFPTSKDWLMRLDVSSGDEFSRVMKSVLDLYEEFQAKFYAEGLLENTGEYPPVSVYDFSRIFLIALDRAMMKLPWGRVTPLLTDALDLAANDMTLGELPGVQKYLFTSGHSLVVARTPELPIQMVLNPQAFELWQEGEGEEKANRFAGQFLNQCEKFFDRP